MASTGRRVLYWAPRVLAVLFAVFVSLFALDVFDAGYGPWETVVALLMHLIPTGLLAVALAVAWRWEWVGAILFIGLGLAYVALAAGPGEERMFSPLALPLLLIGGLFLAAWFWARPRRAA